MVRSSPSQMIVANVSNEDGSRCMGWVSLYSRTRRQLPEVMSRHTVRVFCPRPSGWRSTVAPSTSTRTHGSRVVKLASSTKASILALVSSSTPEAVQNSGSGI